MAMEKLYSIRDTHSRPITAIGYNPARREILIGCEDGVIKSYESETGKLCSVQHEHKGWVTDFLYWTSAKLMLSAANDGDIIAWSSGGGVFDIVPIGIPVYCMAMNPWKKQIVCGFNGAIRIYGLDESKEMGHIIDLHPVNIFELHEDIVRSIIWQDSKIYSAGYDGKLIKYDISAVRSEDGKNPKVNHHAHDAGISCLLMAKDNENNTWVITGSFDKTAKIWTVDLDLVHRLDNFMATVSGICYVPRNKTLWVAGGTSYATLFDPKSGDKVSEFIGTFQKEEEEKYSLQVLKYFNELNEVVACTSRRHLIVWKYNTSGCITALKCKSPLESLCYTKKVPILIFSGDHEGVIMKWERMQSNHFMYSNEPYQISDTQLKKKKKAGSKARELILEQQLSQTSSLKPLDPIKVDSAKVNFKNIQSHYAYNKPNLQHTSTQDDQKITIMKVVFVEYLDYIIAASEDSNIYIWGFDDDAVKALKDMKPEDLDKLIEKYSILLDPDSELLPKNRKFNDNDSVTNRVAGFICKSVFAEHTSCVTSLVVVGREQGLDSTYLLSGGWDSRICIWDLEKGRLHDTFRNTAPDPKVDNLELACDGVIMEMDFSPKYNEFAYSSSDGMVYIRKFSLDGSKMTLQNTLQGHEGEITCVRWNPHGKGFWVTGSDDATIRIWAGHGLNKCEAILSAQGAVSCMCIDQINGCIIVGVQNFIRVYDPENYRLVQTNEGHTDSVRTIMHITERNQYVSCSWDKTIRVWNAYRKPKRKHRPSKNGSKTAKDTISDSRKSSTGSEKKVGFVDSEKDTEKKEGEEEESQSKQNGEVDGDYFEEQEQLDVVSE
ncbi:uncharacterized protein [Mytilus edulis]|uniref:uncharacterized protein isoform X2 n=1 Tax=Mytilus edulis TaxID=6550 RepID=UPI0039EEF743